MTFPTFPQVLKALVLAVVIAVIGFLLYPYLGLGAALPVKLFIAILAAGAFFGGVLNAIDFSVHVGLASESGESMSIFVGNLSFKASQEDLRDLFAPYGNIHSVRIMKDRATRRPRGFAFVEMDSAQAPKAIKALDGKEFMGRKLRVNEGSERSQQAA